MCSIVNRCPAFSLDYDAVTELVLLLGHSKEVTLRGARIIQS